MWNDGHIRLTRNRREFIRDAFCGFGGLAFASLLVSLASLTTGCVETTSVDVAPAELTSPGALSAPGGQVSLTWTMTGGEGARRFELAWREGGGPPVTAPQKTGFGTRLIERGLAGGLKAEVELHYRPEGLVFTLRAPLGEAISEG